MSQKWRCPHCSTLLNRSTQYDFLNETDAIVIGELPTIRCTSCGTEVDAAAVIQGKYDVGSEGMQVWGRNVPMWLLTTVFSVFTLAGCLIPCLMSAVQGVDPGGTGYAIFFGMLFAGFPVCWVLSFIFRA